MTAQDTRARDTVASTAQYLLLGGFAAVAAGISAQGLTGFARSNMSLSGPWPYLLFLALDGAAGVCAVLLVRRSTRAESALAPRLAVWGLVAASSTFNWTHAPRRPAAPEAFGLMPVVAALLLEFCLRELRLRTMAVRTDRKLSLLSWVRPAERLRIQLCMADDEQIPAQAAIRQVRVDRAARSLYQLRIALAAAEHPATSGPSDSGVRRAERRAHRALRRAAFAQPEVAAAVLGQVQVLTMTTVLARLDYCTADAAQAALTNLITAPALAESDSHAGSRTGRLASQAGTGDASAAHSRAPTVQVKSHAEANHPRPSDGNRDGQLVAAAARIVAETRHDKRRLSQAALASRLRRDGYTVANNRLRWLAAVSGLGPQHLGPSRDRQEGDDGTTGASPIPRP